MNAKYAMLKERWSMGYITDATLRGWVAVNDRSPGAGITAEEYEAITGKPYAGNERRDLT